MNDKLPPEERSWMLEQLAHLIRLRADKFSRAGFEERRLMSYPKPGNKHRDELPEVRELLTR